MACCWVILLQLWEQLPRRSLTYLFAGAGTFVILKVLGAVMDLRVSPEIEEQGLDVSEHGEEGYGEDFASGLAYATDKPFAFFSLIVALSCC